MGLNTTPGKDYFKPALVLELDFATPRCFVRCWMLERSEAGGAERGDPNPHDRGGSGAHSQGGDADPRSTSARGAASCSNGGLFGGLSGGGGRRQDEGLKKPRCHSFRGFQKSNSIWSFWKSIKGPLLQEFETKKPGQAFVQWSN